MSTPIDNFAMALWGGLAQAGAGYIPPGFPAYRWSPPASMAIGYDPARADELLDQAGYKKGPDGMRRTPSGRPLTLRLLGENDIGDETADAPYIAEWLKAVGIGVTPLMVAGNDLQSDVRAGDYDLVFDTWAVDPDPDYVLAIQTCGERPATPGGAGGSDDGICDPAYDKLYDAALAAYSPAQRAGGIKAMEQRLYTDHYINVIYYPPSLEAYRRDVIASMDKQPQPGGSYFDQNGYWGLWSAVPAPASMGSPAAGPVAGGVAAAVVVAAAGGLFLLRRRRDTADERE